MSRPTRIPGYVQVGLLFVAAVHLWSFADPPMPAIHGDGLYTYYWARSIAFDGDMDLANDYEICGDPWNKRQPVRPGLGPRNTWSPGPALLWAPVLAGARLLTGYDESPDPRTAAACPLTPMAELSMLATVLAGLLTVWLVYRMAARHVHPAAALAGAMGVALATNLPYYTTLLPSYGHGPAALAVALALERWDATRGSRRLRRWALVGLLVGVAMLMRAQCAVIALAPLMEWLLVARADVAGRYHRRLARHVVAGVLFTACAFAAFFPQMYAWKITYGAYFAVPQGPNYMQWHDPFLDGVLFGTTGGLLVWTPICYLGVVGLGMLPFRRQKRLVGLALVGIFAAFVYINASVWDYWGSSGFSNRRFVEMALPLGLGIAVVAERVRVWAERKPRRMAALFAAVLLFAFASWNYGGMWAIASGRIKSYHEDRADRLAQQVFYELSDNTWDEVGNPLAWPASLPFALRYGTHPKRYDVMRGPVRFYQRFQDGSLFEGENVVRFSTGFHELYCARGFEDEPRILGRRAMVTAEPVAVMLIPLFKDDVARVRISWRAEPTDDTPVRATLRWNAREVASLEVPSRWSDTTLDVPYATAKTGINEMEWTIAGGHVAFSELELLKWESPR